MKVISNTEFGGERPLFESHDLRLENVVIRAGESAIKECSNIEAVDCRFEGNYPLARAWFRYRPLFFRCGRTFGIVVLRSSENDEHTYRRPKNVP